MSIHDNIADDFDMIPINEVDSIAIPKDADAPYYGSKEWNNYVMSHFEDSELIDGNPNCGALRRVAELLLGEIIDSGPIREYAATDPNGPGRATVVFQVIFNWFNGGTLKTFREIADCWHGNTDDLFCAHPSSTASTRAEGRALRKALKVKCLAAEELATKKDVAAIVRQSVKIEAPTTGEISTTDKISSAQINFLDVKCKQLDLNAMAFVNDFMKDSNRFPNVRQREYEDIKQLPKVVACKLLEDLNNIQTNGTVPLDGVRGYIKNWRNN